MIDMRKLIVTLVLTLLAGWTSAAWVPVQLDDTAHTHHAQCCDDDMAMHDTSAMTGHATHHVCCQLLAVPYEAQPALMQMAPRSYAVRDITRVYSDVVHGIFKPPKSNA